MAWNGSGRDMGGNGQAEVGMPPDVGEGAGWRMDPGQGGRDLAECMDADSVAEEDRGPLHERGMLPEAGIGHERIDH